MTDIQDKIPALVVSGFLGAGKTTLVRGLLKQAQETGQRLAVISNEFGGLGIDQALLDSESPEGFIELEGGCVCCQLSNELLTSLQSLWERVHPDRVVVETSGVALPFETLMTFWREPVCEWVDESLAVVVVNAEQIAEGRDLEGTFDQQVSSADIVVLNKIDLVPETLVSTLEAKLDEFAPGTPVIHSVNAAVDSTLLFPPNPVDIVKHRTWQSQESVPHTHEDFDAQVMSIESGADERELIERFQSLKALRIKGLVQTASGLQIVQGVGSRIDLVPSTGNFPSHLIGQVVVIRRSH